MKPVLHYWNISSLWKRRMKLKLKKLIKYIKTNLKYWLHATCGFNDLCMGDSSSALIITKIIHMVIAWAKVMSIIFWNFISDENQEQPFLFSFGDLGMLTLSVQKIKIDKRELISSWHTISQSETDVYLMPSSFQMQIINRHFQF